MKAHFIHGFNVKDGGKKTVDKLIPFFSNKGFEIVEHDYGWVFLFRLRLRNEKTVKEVLPQIGENDIIVAHSNGCLIAWQLIEAGAPAKAVICIQPALRTDTVWREDVSVLCTYNKKDYTVSLGRIWGRLATKANRFAGLHGWGAAGRHGFKSGQPNIENWDIDVEPAPAPGHSQVFRVDERFYWGPRFANWGYIKATTQ